MNITETDLPGVLLVKTRHFKDARGYFTESFNKRQFAEVGIELDPLQINHSHSCRHTLRGLHYQNPHAQGRLVKVLVGAIFDVVVDIRRGSPTFGKWFGVELSAENHLQLWIPRHFAHGFCVLSETTDLIYCTDRYYAPDADRGVAWNDPDLAIRWPTDTPLLSDKDAVLPTLSNALHLPAFREEAR